MHILIDNNLIRNDLFTKSQDDILFNSLYDIMYNEGFLKEKSDLGFYQDERGKESSCTYEELFFFQTLVDYFINLKDAFYKIQCPVQSDIDKLKSDYKLDCIRKYILCKFGNTNLYDKMLVELGLTIDGLDNMVEEGGTNPCIFPLIVA